MRQVVRAVVAALVVVGCGAEDQPVALERAIEEAPRVRFVQPRPWHVVRAGTRVRLEADVVDPGETRSCFFDKDDGDEFASVLMADGTSRCVRDELFRFPGIYSVAFQWEDATTTARATVPVVVYDPRGGWVAGYGAVDSPAGAVAGAPAAAGPARFAMVARYLRGDAPPVGVVLFDAPGGFRFQSVALSWLAMGVRYGTIEPADTASIGGTGTVGGQACEFLLLSNGHRPGEVAAPDGLRLRITCGGTVAYDNGSGPLDPDTSALGVVSGTIVNYPPPR